MTTLSLIIPAYNEEKRLPRTLESLRAAKEAGIFESTSIHEVIIVDDGSTDNTGNVATVDSLPIRILRLPKNKGKGAAVREGMLVATGDFLLSYDADGATPPDQIPVLLAALTEDTDIVIGSRVMGDASGLNAMSFNRRLIGSIYRIFCSFLIPGINDAACGCKLFRANVAKQIFAIQQINRFAFDIEVLSIALRSGIKIREIPVMWTPVPASKVRLFRDGIEMLYSVLKLYFSRKVSIH